MFCLISDSQDAPMTASTEPACVLPSVHSSGDIVLPLTLWTKSQPPDHIKSPWVQPPPSSLRSPHGRQILWVQLSAEHRVRHSQDHLLTYYQLVFITFDGMYFVHFRKKKTIFKHSVKLPKKYGYKKHWRNLNLNYLGLFPSWFIGSNTFLPVKFYSIHSV